jgi:hypothetical protein
LPAAILLRNCLCSTRAVTSGAAEDQARARLSSAAARGAFLVDISNFKGNVRLWQDNWLAGLLALIAIFVLVHLANDYRSGLEFGWDARVNCAAIEAYANGLDPYYVKNLTGTNLSYPYLPVTLDVFRPLCADGFLVRHFRGAYLVVAAAAALLLSSFSFSRRSIREALLKFLYVFGGFVGFEWTFITGNFAIISGLLTTVALALIFYGFSLREKNAKNGNSIACYTAGAAVFGLLTSIKVVFFPVLLSFYFFPLSRRRKITLMIVASVCFIAPALTSLVFYHDLFSSWIEAISGRIPGQHSPASESCNPSLLCLGQSLSESLGFIAPKLAGMLFYGLAAALLVLGPLAASVIRLVKQEYASDDGSFLKKLDQLLIDNPRFALRLTTLSMFALYLCAPRLKEYAFFELAIYAAMLVVDLPAIGIAAVFVAAIVAPMLATGSPNAFVNTFGPTIAAVFCFEIFLLDLYPSFGRLKGNGTAGISPETRPLSA